MDGQTRWHFRLKKPRISDLQGPKEGTVFHTAEQWLGSWHCCKAWVSGPGMFKLVKQLSNLSTFPMFLVPLLPPPPPTKQQSERVWTKVFEVKYRQIQLGMEGHVSWLYQHCCTFSSVLWEEKLTFLKWWKFAKLKLLLSESCSSVAAIKFSGTGPDIQSINSCCPAVKQIFKGIVSYPVSVSLSN